LLFIVPRSSGCGWQITAIALAAPSTESIAASSVPAGPGTVVPTEVTTRFVIR
jgi:hypothetical protein